MTVIVVDALLPWLIAMVDEETLTEKSWFGRWITVTANVVVCETLPPLPVIVRVKEPALAALAAANVITDDAGLAVDGVTGLFEKLTAKPEGVPVADSATCDENPDTDDTLTVTDEELPC